MADNKTKPTGASVSDYIASRANAQQRTDCRELMVQFTGAGHEEVFLDVPEPSTQAG